MNNHDLQNSIRKAFESATPDMLESILERAGQDSAGQVIETAPAPRGRLVRRIAIAAAGVVLIAGVVLSIMAMLHSGAAATVTVDTDATVQLSLSRSRRPLSIVALDKKGERMLSGYGHRSDTAEQAIDSLLGYMIETSALYEENNTVLMTVEGEDADALSLSMLETARECFEIERFDGAVLVYVADEDDESVRRFASHHSISLGKAAMVMQILDAVRDENAVKLARLSVNELSLIARSLPLELSGVECLGEPSMSAYLTEDEAVDKVFADIGAARDEVGQIEVRLGAGDDGLVYIVTVNRGGASFRYILSAGPGDIVEASVSVGSTTTMLVEPATDPPPTEKAETPTAAPETGATDRGKSSPDPDEISLPGGEGAEYRVAPAQTHEKGERTAPTQKESRSSDSGQPSTTTPKPTERRADTPAAFDADSYISVPTGAAAPESARAVSCRRKASGYDLFYDSQSYPYGSEKAALVFNTRQLKALVGNVGDYDDSYFATHALFILMENETRYHWARRVTGAYLDAGVLYIEESDKVGVYSSQTPGAAVNTLVYELNKDELTGFVSAQRYVGDLY